MRTKRRKWLMIIALLISGLLLVACGADEEGGGGLTEGTPMATEQVPGLEDEETPTEEITGTAEVTETATVAATEEPTEEPTEEATEEATEEPTEEPAAGEEGEETVVMRASELMDMPIQDDAGAEIGFVAEVLVDDSSAIQYIVVDVLPDEASGSTESATPGVEETTQPTQTDQTVVRTFIAAPWDVFRVETAEAPDAASESETDDEGADTEEAPESEETAASEVEAERGEVTLVYAGDTALEEQQTFEMEILDEEGYVLDDQGEGDVSVPAEYVGLLQLSDQGDYEIVNTADEELASGAEVLVNLSEGRVAYLVVDVGGFLGIGANSVPIPWDSAQLEVTVEDGTESEVFRVDADEATLEEAPTVELDNWTPRVEAGWDAEFRDYWQSDTTTG